MIAEINSKISKSGSNISDRQEDKLTGDIFGALRYLPYDLGLEKILSKRSVVFGKRIDDFEFCINQTELDVYDEYIEFWPRDKEAELDVLIHTKYLEIGIEVKYLSGLSSDDEDGITFENSNNQIIREMRSLLRRCDSSKKAVLIFIAMEPECREIATRIAKDKKLSAEIEFSYLSWETILESINSITTNDPFYKVILKDMCDLLSKKNFNRFTDFSVEEIVNDVLYFSF
jgi:hypothetical protein